MIIARKKVVVGEDNQEIDLGHVGKWKINPGHPDPEQRVIPVISSIGVGYQGKLQHQCRFWPGSWPSPWAAKLILLTDVEGIYEQPGSEDIDFSTSSNKLGSWWPAARSVQA